MKRGVYQHLRPVRTRQGWQRALRAGALGLFAGSCLAILPAVARLFGLGFSSGITLLFPLAGLGLGLLAGLVAQPGWHDAAAAVDRHYRLKDRTGTALRFLDDPHAGVFHHLQIADALAHLERVDARTAAPVNVPRSVVHAGAAFAVVVALVAVPNGVDRAKAAVSVALPQIVAEAEHLERSMIERIERLAEGEEAFRSLLDELGELVGEMKEPGVDERDALEKLSKMEAAIAGLLAEYDLKAMDAKLKQLAEALAPAQELKDASKSLRDEKYDRAAEQLDRVDPSKISPKEAQTLAEKLHELAETMEAGPEKLIEAASEMAEGLDQQDDVQIASGADKMASVSRQQATRKKIGARLQAQLAELAAAKTRCRDGANGGNNKEKSDQPGDSWGVAPSNKPFGDPTTPPLDAQRQRQEITGTHGEGPSEKEAVRAAGQHEDAARGYRDVYQEYQKMSEAVLESEPLPLGHRETIRRYFELIHPTSPASAEGQP